MADSRERYLSAMALAYEWASRIVALSVVLGLFSFGGYWLDLKLGTEPVLLMVFTGVGGVAALVILIRWTSPEAKKANPGEDESTG